MMRNGRGSAHPMRGRYSAVAVTHHRSPISQNAATSASRASRYPTAVTATTTLAVLRQGRAPSAWRSLVGHLSGLGMVDSTGSISFIQEDGNSVQALRSQKHAHRLAIALAAAK